MKIVIEIEDSLTDAMIRRQLADVQAVLEDDDSDGWAGLETPYKWFKVTRIVGVLYGTRVKGASVPMVVAPLEGSKEVEL